MTLQSSGPISIDDINVELGNSPGTTLNLGSTECRDLAGVPSGPISLSDFYGASAEAPALPGTTQTVTKSGGPFNGTVATASWGFHTDGTVVGGVQVAGYSGSADHTWWDAAPVAGIGNSYQVRVSAYTGTAPQGLSVGTWYTMSTNRSWFLNATSGTSTKTNSMTIQIRAASGGAVLATGTYDLNAFYF